MLYPITKLLVALSLAYATVPPHARQNLREQLTIKHLARHTASALLTAAACNVAHEAGHILVGRALGIPWPTYVCIGAHQAACTPKHAFFNLGNVHFAGWDIQRMAISKIETAVTNGQYLPMLLAGPLSGLLAYACIKRLSKNRMQHKYSMLLQIENLLPAIETNQHYNDGAQIIANIPPLAPLLQNQSFNVATLAMLLGLRAYGYWPGHRVGNQTEQQTKDRRSCVGMLRNLTHAGSLAYCNQALINNFELPIHFDTAH